VASDNRDDGVIDTGQRYTAVSDDSTECLGKEPRCFQFRSVVNTLEGTYKTSIIKQTVEVTQRNQNIHLHML
jgi:predicted aspartyl protease